MKVAAVIAEFNPFHNGHEMIANEAKRWGADAVIAVMSGNWVQRGDTAIISKFSRARQALLCGYDLVAELPTSFAMSSAQRFAAGGVYIADALTADALVFGSECGDITKIMKTVYCTRSSQFERVVKELLGTKETLARARETAVNELCGCGELLRSPNDTLAIEYINAAKDLNSKMEFEAIKRVGAGHDSETAADGVCSASRLRSTICDGRTSEMLDFMPKNAAGVLLRDIENGKISDIKRIEKAILMTLKMSAPQELALLPDISEGIENRIYGAARISSTLDELYKNAATKRYTNARLRRLVLSALLREKRENQPDTPRYIRILGLNRTGANVLERARKTCPVPIIMRATSLKESKEFDFECKATEVYSLSLAAPDPSGAEYTNGIIVIK